MNNIIKLYEAHREILVDCQQKAKQQLVIIYEEKLEMSKETIEVANEAIGLISYMNTCIDVIDYTINELKKEVLEEEA